jgi:hypothetical protein
VADPRSREPAAGIDGPSERVPALELVDEVAVHDHGALQRAHGAPLELDHDHAHGLALCEEAELRAELLEIRVPPGSDAEHQVPASARGARARHVGVLARVLQRPQDEAV